MKIQKPPARGHRRKVHALCLIACFSWTTAAWAQLDPERRELIQVGVNQAFEGHGPIAAYAFYYDNQPNWHGTNMSLRLAVAPVYLDGELGFKNLLGQGTDFAVGVSGGGFADSYYEIHHGEWLRDQSFTGHGVGFDLAAYHLFNPLTPGATPASLADVPLQGILRVGPRYTFYQRDDHTAANFDLPDDRWTYFTRVGLRWGGREPLMSPDRAVELSAWYDGQFRTDTLPYGYGADRDVNAQTHLFWTRALLAWGFEGTPHHFEVSTTAGTSLRADRLSAYRLGGDLPLMGEFPLTVPGYYLQELSARQFALLAGEYDYAITPDHAWTLRIDGAVADVGYLPAYRGSGQYPAGVGGGIGYSSPGGMWHVIVGYDRGLTTERRGGHGSNVITMLLQIDLERSPGVQRVWKDMGPSFLKGLQGMFRR
jgi:hypothetical protein